VAFYREMLGLRLRFRDDEHGYASFDTGASGLALARIDPAQRAQRELVGRQTGVALAVPDLLEAHEVLSERGVEFALRPTLQPWGGLLAILRDCEGNLLYLDERPQASMPPSATNSEPVQ
jgi:predicted enzyme related to lactoylglutathione lyase